MWGERGEVTRVVRSNARHYYVRRDGRDRVVYSLWFVVYNRYMGRGSWVVGLVGRGSGVLCPVAFGPVLGGVV